MQMNLKYKLISIACFTGCILLCGSLRLFAPTVSAGAEDGTAFPAVGIQKEASEVFSGGTLGGIVARMPDISAKILFESILGTKLSAYRSYDNIDNMLAALYTGEVDGIWASDCTAAYLLYTYPQLQEFSIDGQMMSAPSEGDREERMQFVMVMKPEDTLLQEEINLSLALLQRDGTLEQLLVNYVDGLPVRDTRLFYEFHEKDMTIRQSAVKRTLAGDTIYVGVTGAVPPIDRLDANGEPCGFSVALMDQIGICTGRDVKFVVVSNETAFSCLMAGKVDVLFCYGSSPNTLDTASPYPYIVSDGYHAMFNYCFLGMREMGGDSYAE